MKNLNENNPIIRRKKGLSTEDLRVDVDVLSSSLAQKANQTDVRLKIAKLGQTDMTEEFLQQIVGSTPINAVPALGSVTPQMLNFKTLEGEVGKNLFNKNAVTVGYYIKTADGTLGVNADYSVSEFITVDPSNGYFLKHSSWSAFYDINKAFISGGSYNGFTPPANAAFFRCSILNTNLETQQLEIGSGASPYEPYKTILKKASIENDEMFKPKAIKADKLEYIPVKGAKSKNLFDKDNVTTGYYVRSDSGVLAVNADYVASEFIEIASSTGYVVKHSGQMAFFDVDKKYISGGTFTTLTTPATAKYIRISTLLTNLATQQLELGSVATEFVPAGGRVPDGGIYLATMFKDGIVPETALNSSVQVKLNAASSSQSSDPFNAEKGLRKYRSVIAKLDAGIEQISNVCFVGDSITEGVGSSPTITDYVTKGYLGRLRSRMNTKYGDVGTGMKPSFHAGQWTFSGTWNDFTLVGIAGVSKWSSTVGSTATIAFNGTGFDLVTYNGAGLGVIEVTVDGGTPFNVDLYNATTAIRIVNLVSGLTDGNHTLVIKITVAEKQVHIIGGYEKKGTKGIRLNMCGKSGVSSAQLTTNNNIMTSEIDVWNPVLTVIATITNDIGQNLTVDAYKTNMQTLITRAKTFGDVLLLPTNVREDKTDAVQAPYVNALKELAILNDCAMINIYSRWGFKGQSLGFMDDILHPNSVGHQDIANALSEKLLI
jgi:hypothetical protein